MNLQGTCRRQHVHASPPRTALWARTGWRRSRRSREGTLRFRHLCWPRSPVGRSSSRQTNNYHKMKPSGGASASDRPPLRHVTGWTHMKACGGPWPLARSHPCWSCCGLCVRSAPPIVEDAPGQHLVEWARCGGMRGAGWHCPKEDMGED